MGLPGEGKYVGSSGTAESKFGNHASGRRVVRGVRAKDRILRRSRTNIADYSFSGFGGKALAPKWPADPIADFHFGLPDCGRTAATDEFAIIKDRKRSTIATLFDKSDGIVQRIRVWDARCHTRNIKVTGKFHNASCIFALRCSQ